MTEIYHVYPINDKEDHSGIQCKCNPKLKNLDNGNTIVIHNAMDGRELFEISKIQNN